jgi:hypothetical protein
MSCFLGMLHRYVLNDFLMVPVAPIITGITFLITFHKHYVSIIRSLYFTTFSASFSFLSPEIAVSFSRHILFLLSWMMMSSLLGNCQF